MCATAVWLWWRPGKTELGASLYGVVAETVTVAVAFSPGAPMTVAVMLWLPGVFNVTPLVNVWEPASLATK
ncbi:MAG TPA: hypothetical protein VFL34_08625 [Candidatus Sulfotelmatobacter sp.]|nr:hypothetical protein [Candidatus Sulfotelmatobacter sp.]